MATRGRKPTSGSTSEPPETNGSGQSTPSSSVVGLLRTVSADVEREEVKVNNVSVTDMKHACDDALKRVSTSSCSYRGLARCVWCSRRIHASASTSHFLIQQAYLFLQLLTVSI